MSMERCRGHQLGTSWSPYWIRLFRSDGGGRDCTEQLGLKYIREREFGVILFWPKLILKSGFLQVGEE